MKPTEKELAESKTKEIIERWLTHSANMDSPVGLDAMSHGILEGILIEEILKIKSSGLDMAAQETKEKIDYATRLGFKPAYIAGCQDLLITFEAKALRVKRGEYENPTSECMSCDGSSTFFYELSQKVSIDKILDYVFETFDNLFKAGNFGFVDSIIGNDKVSSLDNSIQLGILTASLPAKKSLKNRQKLFETVTQNFEQKHGKDKASELLKGLE